MRKREKERRYRGRDQLISDVHLLLDNCRIFNGDDHKYTMVAEQLLETCITKLGEVFTDRSNKLHTVYIECT